jgi:uncharacterized protein YjbI with pentapeptide repeats
MASFDAVGWDVCTQCLEVDGIGVQVHSGAKCWAHADDENLDAALKRLGEGGPLDARGVTITAELLGRIMAAATQGRVHPILHSAKFDRATFQGGAGFLVVTFKDTASFDQVRFEDAASFHGATFEGSARFDKAAFGSEAEFGGATFKGDASFSKPTFVGASRLGKLMDKLMGVRRGKMVAYRPTGFRTFVGTFTDDTAATFKGNAQFDRATFEGTAGFAEVTFGGEAGFGGVTFGGEAGFGGAIFKGNAEFQEATFKADARVAATFEGRARFDGATFEAARDIGPLVAWRGLSLDRVTFQQPVQIEASAAAVCFRSARFQDRTQLRLRWAQVVLDDADFAGPSLLTIATVTESLSLRERRIAKAWQRLPDPRSKQPRLLSLRRANVANLTVANVDLSDCRFEGAHNLDKLRLGADTALATAPRRPLQWDRRSVIAEERAWRAEHSHRWLTPTWPTWLQTRRQGRPAPLPARDIAGLYRALRKGREDAKDEPGAADFYYGEMEMRRHAAPRFSVERAVLTLYWLVSGYALRAWRALVALTAVLVVAAWLLAYRHGFADSQAMTFWGAFRYSGRTAIGLLPKDQPMLTPWGDVLQITVRVTVPVLLGLAILSIRGRVKR